MKLYPGGVYSYTNEYKKYFIYLGDCDNKNDFFAVEIGDEVEFKSCYKFTDKLKLVAYVDHIRVLNYNLIFHPLYIKGEVLKVQDFQLKHILSHLCANLLDDLKVSVLSIIEKNFDFNNNKFYKISFVENILKYIYWTLNKTEIKFNNTRLIQNVLKYGIYWAILGDNIGSENKKTRPVLVWKVHEDKENHQNSSYFVFPITSKLNGSIYDFNYIIDLNDSKNIIKLNDGRRISVKRIVKPFNDNKTKKLYRLTQTDIKTIKEKISRYFIGDECI